MQPTHSSRRILLPVRNWFIVLTLFLALVLNLVPFGRLPGIPDWVALVLGSRTELPPRPDEAPAMLDQPSRGKRVKQKIR